MNPKVPKRPGAQVASQATRAKRRKAEQFGSQAAACRASGCCACVASLRDAKVAGVTPAQHARWLQANGYEPLHPVAHHEPPRGTGNNSGDADTVPLCTKHHTERHSMPAAEFWSRYGLDPEAVKARMRGLLETHASHR